MVEDLLLDGYAFLTHEHRSQKIEVFVNNHPVATLIFDRRLNSGVRVVKISKDLALKNKGGMLIKMSLKNPKLPAELGLSEDKRRLGLGLVSLELRTTETVPGR